MEFLKNQFDFEGRNRRKGNWIFGRCDHDDNHDDHDEQHDNDHHYHYRGNHSQTSTSNPVMESTGLICTLSSTQLVPGAKYCHHGGMTIEPKTKCTSCGFKSPANARFSPPCGYKKRLRAITF